MAKKKKAAARSQRSSEKSMKKTSAGRDASGNELKMAATRATNKAKAAKKRKPSKG